MRIESLACKYGAKRPYYDYYAQNAGKSVVPFKIFLSVIKLKDKLSTSVQEK